METKQCKNCQSNFQIAPEDLEFYEKMNVPTPTLCPLCRQQRRLAFRNEFNLYQRKCDHTGEITISMYSPDAPYKVYNQKAWWSDDWDPMSYSRDFDFSKPFFEQFGELQKEVPRMSLNCIDNENSEYTNYTFRNKSSYLVFTADYNEKCMYGRVGCKNYKCLDWNFTHDSNHCHEVVDTKECTKCFFSQKCENSSELLFCYNMKNCHDCILSANLRNKRNYILNKQVSPEEFEKFKVEMNLRSHKDLKKAIAKAEEFLSQQPRKYLEMLKCEESLGDYIQNCKNAYYCFDSENLHDVKYASGLGGAKDCYDWDIYGVNCELCYEIVSSAYQLQNCKFCMNSWDGNYNLSYCDLCLGSKDLFGCIGLRKKQYCILNKQYTKEEYEELVPKIIEHMEKTGEWGEFFPITMSPFAYNKSIAQDYFPMTKEQLEAKGYKWENKNEKEYQPQNFELPDHIKHASETILEKLLACEECGKNYKITPQELAFYKEFEIALPRTCYNCRHKTRMQKRNPRKMIQRTCDKCSTQIWTTHQVNNPAPIYCEKCYLDEMD